MASAMLSNIQSGSFSSDHVNDLLAADPLAKFLELSRTLFSLISLENHAGSGENSREADFEIYIGQKANLMRDFEKEAQNLLNYISIGLSSPKTRQTVTGEVERIREASRKNSVLKLQRLKAKIAGDVSSLKPEEGIAVTCH